MAVKRTYRIIILCFLVVAVIHIAGCRHGDYGRQFKTRRVVFVVIDGVRHTEFFSDSSHAYCPGIWNELRPYAVISHAMYNNGITRTFPGHASLLSGRYQFLPNDGSRRSYQPMIWEYLRDQTGVRDSAVVLAHVKAKIRELSYSTQSGFGEEDSAAVIGPYPDDVECVRGFFSYAGYHAPVLSVVCLGTVDIVGHSGDWNSYVSAIRTADSLTVEIWKWIERTDGFAGVTSMFVTADHGRHDVEWDNHGCHCEGCRRLPFLAIGPDMKTGVELGGPERDIIDIAPTAARILGIDMPLAEGRILTEILDDPIPPRRPRVEARMVVSGMLLEWKPVLKDRAGSPEAILFYRVYRDTFSIPVATVHTSSYLDTTVSTVQKPKTYHVRAVDIGGNESEPSNTVFIQGSG